MFSQNTKGDANLIGRQDLNASSIRQLTDFKNKQF